MKAISMRLGILFELDKNDPSDNVKQARDALAQALQLAGNDWEEEDEEWLDDNEIEVTLTKVL